MSTDVARPAPAGYRFSVLFKSLAVMWRTTGPALLFIVINTVVQGFLTWLNTQSGFSFGFLVAFLVSAISALIPSLAITGRWLGASPPVTAIWIAIEEKLAKPHRAKVTTPTVRSDRSLA